MILGGHLCDTVVLPVHATTEEQVMTQEQLYEKNPQFHEESSKWRKVTKQIE